jgi:glycosidase
MENGSESAWADWFHLDGFPVDAYGDSRAQGWLGSAAVPELNLANPGARRYMLGVAEFWTAEGIDGWRLDAVAHLQHRAFWRELRDVVRRINPEAYLLAEIWENPTPWLDAGDFDGATHYELREILVDFIFRGGSTASAFARSLQALLGRYTPATARAMCNVIGSHDTERLWTLADGETSRIRMLLALAFALPGIPWVYYGDETGLAGGADPDNRRGFEWDQRRWNVDLRPLLRTLVGCRLSSEAMREGTWQTAAVDDARQLCLFLRESATDRVAVVVHRGTSPVSAEWPVPFAAAALRDALSGQMYAVHDGMLQLQAIPPSSVAILQPATGHSIETPRSM